MDNQTKLNKEKSDNGEIHFITSHSYIVFLFAVGAGIFLDLLIPLDIFSGIIYQYVGLGMIILGSVIAYWTHKASDIIKKIDNGFDFQRGPYKHIRNPGYFGVFIMTLGLAFLINSPLSIVFVILAHAFTT